MLIRSRYGKFVGKEFVNSNQFFSDQMEKWIDPENGSANFHEKSVGCMFFGNMKKFVIKDALAGGATQVNIFIPENF